MGSSWCFFFGEKDAVLVEEIAKNLHVEKEVVEKHYKEMLKAIEKEVKGE